MKDKKAKVYDRFNECYREFGIKGFSDPKPFNPSNRFIDNLRNKYVCLYSDRLHRSDYDYDMDDQVKSLKDLKKRIGSGFKGRFWIARRYSYIAVYVVALDTDYLFIFMPKAEFADFRKAELNKA